MAIPPENCGTVLVVDDDPAVLVLIERILAAANHRVLPASRAADAMRLVSQKHLRIDLALLDVRMPDMSGTALATEILSVRPRLPVLFMSGFVDDEFVRLKLVDRTARLLPKPFCGMELLPAVRQAIETGCHLP